MPLMCYFTVAIALGTYTMATEQKRVFLPTAPSPTTTHLMACTFVERWKLCIKMTSEETNFLSKTFLMRVRRQAVLACLLACSAFITQIRRSFLLSRQSNFYRRAEMRNGYQLISFDHMTDLKLRSAT